MFFRVMPKHRPLTEDALQLVAQRFAVLAEPMRLRLIQALLAGERNVTELVRATGGTQANISRHLQTLIAAHILTRRKEGLQVFYRIADPTIPRLCELVCGSLAKTLTRQAAHFELRPLTLASWPVGESNRPRAPGRRRSGLERNK